MSQHAGKHRQPPARPPRSEPSLPSWPNPPLPQYLEHCLYTCIFLWIIPDGSFWFFPTMLSPPYLSGYRWRYGGWIHVTFNLRIVKGYY